MSASPCELLHNPAYMRRAQLAFIASAAGLAGACGGATQSSERAEAPDASMDAQGDGQSLPDCSSALASKWSVIQSQACQDDCFATVCQAQGGVVGSVSCVFGLGSCSTDYQFCYPQPPSPAPDEFRCQGVVNCKVGQSCGPRSLMGDGCEEDICTWPPGTSNSSSGGSSSGSSSSGG